MGELAERFARELGADVQAVDLSPRMVELTQSRGIEAQVADIQRLPFPDGVFDCVVAAWVLYHLPEVDAGVAEIDRVLRPGGHLVAATVGERNLSEVWDLVGGEATRDLSFGPENGEEVLRRRFASVERVDAEGTLVFPDTDAVRKFVAMTITRAHLARDVPPLTEPLRARTSHVIFVAAKSQ